MTAINEELYKLHRTSPWLELYTIDCTAIGGGRWHFSPSTGGETSTIAFGGITYLPMPISTKGWELSATGASSRPQLTVSNVNKVLFDAVVTLGDIVNAKVVRTRTFHKFCDGQPEADSDQYVGPDVFYVYQKVQHNKNQITWALASPLEAFGEKLPKRQFLKNDFPGMSRYKGS